MNDLRISKDLVLPPDFITQASAIIARRGRGKTYTGLVIAEECLKNRLHTVIVDPIGVCWGLRSSADGEKAGLPITILGGAHADVPLDPQAGALVAELVVETKASILLDISEWTGGEQERFMAAFGERLYQLNRDPLLLILDEADAWAPQVPMPDQRRMLGAVEKLVRRGRARGIGCLMITQRAAVLNKNVLSQVEVLISMQVTGPQDRKALDSWVSQHGTDEERKTFLDALASIPIGEAFLWSPSWLNFFGRIQIRRRETFDSSATPKAGEVAKTARVLAKVELDAFQEKMAATIERAKSEDPRELRQQIARLQAELAKAAVTEVVKEVEVPVPVPILEPGQLERLSSIAHDLIGLGKDIVESANGIRSVLETHCLQPPLGEIRFGPAEEKPDIEAIKRTTAKIIADAGQRDPAPTPARYENDRAWLDTLSEEELDARLQPKSSDVADAPEIRAGSSSPEVRQAILDELAGMAAIGVRSVERKVLAMLVGFAPTTKSYTYALSFLRKEGFIDVPASGYYGLTETGKLNASAPSVPRTLQDYHRAWFQRMGRHHRCSQMLDLLIRRHPGGMTREQLADAMDLALTTKSFTYSISALREFGAVEKVGNEFRVTKLLFPAGLK